MENNDESMLAEQRRARIASIVQERGSASTETLIRSIGVSKMTLWRDLKLLEETGELRRVRGGAVPVGSGNSVEPLFERKSILNRGKKRAIGELSAQRFITDGDVVVLEGGTTAVELVRWLGPGEATILTNGLDVLNAVSKVAHRQTVMCCGGILRTPSRTFVGPSALQFFSGFRADVLFVSGSGLTGDRGLTDINPLEIEVKRAMASSAERVVIVADSSKFGKASLQPLLKFDECDAIVTDWDLSEEQMQHIRAITDLPILVAEEP